MGKQWLISYNELKHEPSLGKLYNAEKFAELNKQLAEVDAQFNHDAIKSATRMLVEEVTNIISHNKSWQGCPLRVRTDYKVEGLGLKMEINYSGLEYFDPEEHQLTTVIGSRNEFELWSRSVERKDGFTTITIRVRFKQ
ncbi:MAG: hypothetical protein PHF00_02960 [Elusimicrobia bacterium]|nr:hypothetical protein [Elusimicrobiota bacterium]